MTLSFEDVDSVHHPVASKTLVSVDRLDSWDS